MPLILAPRQQRLMGCSFEVSLVYIVIFRQARAT